MKCRADKHFTALGTIAALQNILQLWAQLFLENLGTR